MVISVTQTGSARFFSVAIRAIRFNLAWFGKPGSFYLNNIGDEFAQNDDEMIFAVQLWKLGFSVEPLFRERGRQVNGKTTS